MLPSGISVRIRENLVEGAARTQTTLIIDPIVTLSGDRVAMSDIGDKGYGKIDQGNSREELISWTGITDNTTTYTLTGVVWGVNFHNLVGSVAANMKRHNSGSVFSINTDMHYIAEQFVSSDDFSVTDNSLEWGDGLDNDKTIYAKNGDTDKPFIRYDASENKFLISNNGVDTFDPQAGGSGLVAGHGIDINAGAIDVDLSELTTDTALDVTSGQIVVKFDESTLVENSADGIKLVVIDTETAPSTNINKLVKTDANGKVSTAYLTDIIPATIVSTGNNQVTSGRAVGTIYQNTSGRHKLVVISGWISAGIGSGGIYIDVNIGVSSPPTTRVAYNTCDDNGSAGQKPFSISFIAPVNYYYSAVRPATSGNLTLSSWFECDLI